MDSGWLADWAPGLSIASLTLLVFISMVLAALVGFGLRRLQRRLTADREEVELSQEGTLIGGMLGLLALLLAFSFSMALDRYEERRHLVVEEANAIGTSYLRAQLLDEPHRARMSRLLISYAENRLDLASAAPVELEEKLARNNRLLTDLWAAVRAARDSADAHGISVPVTQSFNEIIDLDTERKVARLVRVPAPVLLLLLAFLIVTATVLGFVLEERRGRIGASVLFVLLSLSVGIIIDLNNPVSGSIRESQQPMRTLVESLKSQPPAAFDRFASSGGNLR